MQRLGGSILVVIALILIVAYAYLLFLASPQITILAIKVTIYMFVLAVSAVIGWIGYIMLTSPKPKPVEELQKEIEEEIKRLEEKIKNIEQKSEAGRPS